jgi:LysM repeat protein
MKIIVYLSFLFVFTIGCSALAQQKYKIHYVKKGETVYSIAKQYGVSTEAIYKLNPDVTNGVKVNAILIIPEGNGATAEKEDVRFKTHKVRRKETLFGIAQQYNISVDDIKKYNKELYSRQVKKGEKISIPVYSKKALTNSNTNKIEPEAATHTVAAKETKYGIARKYGITILELEAMNPTMGESLQIGTVLKVPEAAVISSASIDEDYDFYEVQPKEGFFRLKVKLGLSEEEIVALNPYASDGLKEGMILKIPKENLAIIGTDQAVKVDLASRISNKSKKNLVVLLPFRLNKVETDSVASNEELLKKGGTLRVALDFYSGVLMAAEFAKDKGISVHLDVYDTEGSEAKTKSLISKHNFKNVDAVIGPLRQKNVEVAAAMLRDTKTPVFSPLSNLEMEAYSNCFQTVPTNVMLRRSMLEFLKANSQDKNLLLISDTNRKSQKAEIVNALPGIKTISPREKGFLYVVDIDTKLVKEQENWVILESNEPTIISNVVGLLNGIPESYRLRLFTLDKNDAFDYHDVSNLHLAKLNFTFPSVNKSYNYKEKDPFLVSYKNKYGVYPNRYAVRGFDITYDILLRLATADDVYEATESDYETEYVENKFRYTRNSSRGYQNQATYLIKYMNNLEFEIVK